MDRRQLIGRLLACLAIPLLPRKTAAETQRFARGGMATERTFYIVGDDGEMKVVTLPRIWRPASVRKYSELARRRQPIGRGSAV